MVAAVDETVDAVRRPGQQSDNGTEAIVPGNADVAFANKGAVMKMLTRGRKKAMRKMNFLFMLLSGSHSIRAASIGRIFGT